ncbi:MAG: hypothetical protein JSV34_04595 [Candidatus Omnitrophota bacterium]|nr:MAG: hypothetical protein JSV34_04595 [Candidatus Omnitrophota bacterium]
MSIVIVIIMSAKAFAWEPMGYSEHPPIIAMAQSPKLTKYQETKEHIINLSKIPFDIFTLKEQADYKAILEIGIDGTMALQEAIRSRKLEKKLRREFVWLLYDIVAKAEGKTAQSTANFLSKFINETPCNYTVAGNWEVIFNTEMVLEELQANYHITIPPYKITPYLYDRESLLPHKKK